MATVNELITALGFKLKPDALANIKKIDTGLKTISDAANKLTFLSFGLKGAFDYFTNSVMGEAQELTNLSKVTGYSIESLQKWKYVAEASGVSSDALISTLGRLRKTYLRTENDIFGLADRFAQMTERESLQFASALGLSEDDLIVLRKGSKELKRIMSDAYIIPSESIQKTAKFNETLSGIKMNLKSMKDEIFMSVSPLLVQTAEKFKNWTEENKKFIALGIEKTIKVTSNGFGTYLDILGSALSKTTKFVEQTGLLGENLTDVDVGAKIVTGALLVMTGTKIIGGLAGLTKGIADIYGLITTLDNVLTGGLIGRASSFSLKISAMAAEFWLLYEVVKELRAMISDTDAEIKRLREANPEDLSWWELPIAGAVEMGADFGEWIMDKIDGSPEDIEEYNKKIVGLAKEKSDMLLPEGFDLPASISVDYMDIPKTLNVGTSSAPTTITNSDSHATVNFYVTTLQESMEKIKQLGYGLAPVSPGAYIPMNQ